MKQKIYILATSFSDYEAYEFDIKGATRVKAFAEAWAQHDVFTNRKGGYSSEVVEVVLDGLPTDVLKRIGDFLMSPFCECGHRKAHHLKGPKNTRCLHNHKMPYKTQEKEGGPWVDVPPHVCKEFRERK